MFGKLTFAAVPIHDPIIMGAVVSSTILGIIILALITYFRQWGYLWREWLTTCDHKRIGIMYIILAMVMLLRGFADGLMLRSQQAMATKGAMGYLGADHFNQIFTAHGVIMIIFMAMPFLTGLMNIIVPQQIGARDVAFPFMNAVSWWLTFGGMLLVMLSLGLGEFSAAGWSGYAPLTEKAYSPGTGVDYWAWSIQLAGAGSLLSGINFFVTIMRMRAPGMTLMKMPLFIWTTLTTNVLMILSFPVLTIALLLVSLDRYLGMHFFSNDMGGNMMMYANLFWIWGHPEVYIVILPAFGIFSEVVSTFSGKKLFGYASLVYATIAIMILSFTVWVHHFFTMGASATLNVFFGISTMAIAIPTGVKVFDWLLTMYRGRIRFTVPMYWTLGFFTTFVVGGMTGVLMAVPPADYVVHNSLFLIAHFHNMLIPGSLFGFVAGYNYWFPKAFGFTLDETWGKRAFWCWLIGFLFAFIPLYILGFMGMPRRMAFSENIAWIPWLYISMIGVAFIALGILCQLIQVYVSIRDRHKNRDLSGDPWDGRTLEWSIASPPPVYNFAVIPHVDELDQFHEDKEAGTAYVRPETYHDIHMPKNSPVAIILGAFGFLFCFSMIWYIWWLAGVSLVAVVACIIWHGCQDEREYVISAEEVAAIEEQHYQNLIAAGKIKE